MKDVTDSEVENLKFSEKDIFNMCDNGKTFFSGRKYLEEGRIKKIDDVRINSEEGYIYAKVKGSHIYNVTVWTENGRVSQKVCDCPAFHKFPGICKHIAAVLLSYADDEEETPEVSARTEPAMRLAIRAYTNRENAAILSVDGSDRVTLVPHLLLTNSRTAYIDFKVGIGRKYIIKDLCAFSRSVDNCEYVEYGKNFGFLHTRNAFDGRSRLLADFIGDLVRENEIFNNSYNKYSFMHTLSARELTLSETAVDTLADIYMGETISITDKFENDLKLTLKAENPLIHISVKSFGKNAVRVESERFFVLFGRKHCYIITRDTMYKCSEEYTSAMGDFLSALAASDGIPLTIGEDDMVLFANNVLPSVSCFTDIEFVGIDISTYAMPEASVKFFIDNPSRGTVTCKTECSYGDTHVDLLADTSYKRTYRNKGLETNIKTCLMRYFDYTDNGEMIIRDDEDAVFRLADTGLDELRQFGEVYVSEQFERIGVAPTPKISVGVSLSEGILNLEFDTGEFNLRELSNVLKSYRQKKKYHRLKDGAFLKLEDNALAAVAEAVGDLGDKLDKDDGTLSVPRYRALYIDSVLKGEVDVRRDANFKELIRNIKSVEDSDFRIPESLRKILRNFQRTGFRWLKTLDSYGLSGILADEMGLGKTLQIISLFLSEKEEGDSGCSLIVCPASLVYNWESEFAKFAPALSVCVVSGTPEERENIVAEHEKYDVLITSYDLLKRDTELYSDISFRFEVIDEAQYIKNNFTQSAKAVKSITARSRFALTGTPIENRLSELWSIFDFLMPGFLYEYQSFRNEFEIPIVKDKDETVLLRLRRMIAPFILRRLKADVLQELPEKLENVVISRMDAEQEKLYTAHAAQLRDNLKNSSEKTLGKDAVRILAELTRLRQICCDPSLFYENYSGGSAKMETCMDIVRESVENGHKVLIFSQFTSMLEIFEKRLRSEKIDFFTLTGATSKEKRMSLVNSFREGNTPVFLISLKAGGTGLNLTAADVVIHYDPWWNTAAQEQATDRAHRIGQKHVVTVYKFIAKGTIEENILKLQESKKNLAESIISGGEVSGALSKEDILAVLEGTIE